MSHICNRAPKGWRCTRYHGHTGPCAAWPHETECGTCRRPYGQSGWRYALVIGYTVLAMILASAWACDAQSLSLEVGKVYNIRLGEYVTATMPSVEYSWRKWSFGITGVLHERQWLERDTYVRFDQPWKRLTFYGTYNRYAYLGDYGTDWTWLAGVRWEVR